MTTPRPSPRPRRRMLTGALVGGLACLGGLLAGTPTATADPAGEQRLYLVALEHDAARAPSFVPQDLRRLPRLALQDAVLASVGAPEPVYRWTSALDGFAVRLDDAQAARLREHPAVDAVEPNEVRPVASGPGDDGHVALGRDAPRTGGAGVVVGVVDTGLAPENPLFATNGRVVRPRGFTGECADGEQWSTSLCTAKVPAARWFVEGFGRDRLRAASVLSPRDTDGHGTQVASVAAGNAGVPVRVGGEQFGRFGGMAPDASIAVYKACWSAPDPDDDGCATADLVTAVDHAVADGVDVLNLSVGGPGAFDVLELALLGAVERDVVVVGAAGNTGDRAPAAHPSPWVLTVGATTGDVRRGRVVLPDGRRLEGAMLSRREVGPRRVVLAGRAAARGRSRAEASVCTPGSLDAALVRGAVVLCERGGVGRIDKSAAVDLADGAAMVLVNTGRDTVDADAHRVPTVHLDAAEGRTLRRWVARSPGARLSIEPVGRVRRAPRVASWSAHGDPEGAVVKPDLVAPGTGVPSAVPAPSGASWAFVSGTSAATAYTAGFAATLLARDGWSAQEVRSALVTSADPLQRTSLLAGGAGRLRPAEARRPGLGVLVDPHDYRHWLEGDRRRLNTPSVLMVDGEQVARRTLTNISGRRLYFSSSTRGFRSRVRVTPAALRLGPGESATFTVRVTARRGVSDDGYVLWRGATGTVTRVPVLLTR